VFAVILVKPVFSKWWSKPSWKIPTV